MSGYDTDNRNSDNDLSIGSSVVWLIILAFIVAGVV